DPPAEVDRVGCDLPHLRERPAAPVRREADIVHQPEGDGEHDDENRSAKPERRPQADLLRDEASGDGTSEHPGAGDHLSAPEYGFELALVSGRRERVDEPGLYSA